MSGYRRLVLAGALLVSACLTVSAQEESAGEDLVAGRTALEDGFYQVAAERLEAYVEAETSRDAKANAALLLFRAWYGLGRYARIIEWQDDNGRVGRSTEARPGFTFWHAQANYALGNYEEAIADLRRFEKRYAESEFAAFALRLLALSYRDSGRLSDAEEMFARIDAEYPDRAETPDNLLDWAGVLIRQERVEEAERLLERLVVTYDGTEPARRARLWLGQSALERRAPKQAADWLVPLTGDELAGEAIRANAWIALARSDVARERMTNALFALEQGEQLSTNLDQRVNVRIDRARLLMELGDLDQAIEVLDNTVLTLASQPQAERAQRELADLLRAQKKYEQAAEAYQRYLESFSDPGGQRHAQLSKAWCLWQLERYGEAARAFEKAFNMLEDEGERKDALIKAADCYFRNGQYKLAAQSYEKAAEAYPDSEDYPALLFQIAESYARGDDADRAIASLDEVMTEYEGSEVGIAAMLRLARFHADQGRLERAVETYDAFLESYPDSSVAAQAMLERGLLRYENGEYAKALEGFEEVEKTFPETPAGEKAFFMRGWCLYQEGDVEAAIAIANAFLEEFPESEWTPDVRFWLAEHEFNVLNFGNAETNFLAIVESRPGHALADDALYWAGRSAVQQKAYRRAIDAFTRLTRQYTNSVLIPEARFAQGDALTEIGDFAGAILAFQEIINLYPGSPLVARAIGRIGDCQFTLGSDRPARYQEALASFRAAMTHPGASRNLAFQAEYKLARAYERLGRLEEAATHNLNVVYDWLAARDSGLPVDEVWFVRSAFAAAKIKESAYEWNDAMAVYQRVADAGITASRDAELRIDRITKQLRQAGGAGSVRD